MFAYDFVKANTRSNARREVDGSREQEVPPQVQEVPPQVLPQVHNNPQIGNVIFWEIYVFYDFVGSILNGTS